MFNDGIDWCKENDYISELIRLRYDALDRLDNITSVVDKMNVEADRDWYVEYLSATDQLNRIYSSRGWKYLQICYRIKDRVIPQNSVRYLIVRKIFRGLRFVKRSIHNVNSVTWNKFKFAVKHGGLRYAFGKIREYNRNNSNRRSTAFNPDLTVSSYDPPKPPSFVDNAEISTPLCFPVVTDPIVSIIIPVYNQWYYTYNCLKSIIDNTRSKYEYEIIVADDGSNDGTKTLGGIISNVLHIQNEENLGFLRNCNHAASYAKGKYILLLNNDTQVKENWLNSLVDLMEEDYSIGMAGSKLIYPDGTLQEAGGIIWNDATALNYGRGANPADPEYNYVKEVDYISGASIIISKQIWDELDGFDERYAPAYCEDSDLAFAVRALGKRVVYQPKSEVIHFERISHNENDAEKRTSTLQSKNIEKLRSKWQAILTKEHFSPNKHVYIARDRGRYKRRVLFIDDMVPFFDQHAGAKTTYHYLKLLLDLGFDIKFVGDNDFYCFEPYTTSLQQMGIEVLYGRYYMERFKDWTLENKEYFDYIFINRPHIGYKYMKFFSENLPKVKTIYYGHDLHFLREYREYEITKDKAKLDQSRRSKVIELDIMKRADIVLTVSPEEKAIIDKELGKEKSIVTPIFYYDNFECKDIDLTAKKNLMFVGGFNHTPNADGVIWFVENVWPLIAKQIPDVKFYIAGSNPSDAIKKLACENIIVMGYISDEDLKELYINSRVCIIPLRFGAGVKGKTVEAMYNRMAIVSTSIGLEGLTGIEKYISPKDEVVEFANEVIRLYTNDTAIESCYNDNVKYIQDNLSYNSALKLFGEIFGSGSII